MEQYEKIEGYRKLTDEEISLMNRVKKHAEEVRKCLDMLESADSIDKRWIAIGRTNLQQGFMAVIRAIARPTTF